MELAELQQSVRFFSKERGFDKSSLEQRALFLVTEVGEVVREVLKFSYHSESEKLEEIKEDLGLEMYDIIWNLCDLANKVGIDLEVAAHKKIEINRNRIW
ncbi:MazG-like family protein [Paenibacillus jamilae]|nr:MazG-like family protein [Paenibacillus jamilae]